MSSSSTVRGGLAQRWKYTNPVRLYLWPAVLLVAAAVAIDSGSATLTAGYRAAALVLLLLAVEAARVSSYSLRDALLVSHDVRNPHPAGESRP